MTLVLQRTDVDGNERNGWCRLCLRKQVLSKSIFAKQVASEKIRSRILDCCPITLFEDDQLPNSICHRCEIKLDVTYAFRQLCRESERVLRACYETSYRRRNGARYISWTNCDGFRDDSVRLNERTEISTDASIEKEKLGNGCEESSNHLIDVASGTTKCTKKKSKKESVEESMAESRKRHGRGLKREPISRSLEQCIVTMGFESICENSIDRDQTECRAEGRKYGRSEDSRARIRILEQQGVTTESNCADNCTSIINSEERSVKAVLKKANIATNEATKKEKEKGKVRAYLCDMCSKTFTSKSGLRFHLKSHNGTKPYSCKYCGKRFVIPSYVKRHEKTHTGDKGFVCQFCSAAFASSNGLKYHLRSHTGETNYCCERCGKSFCRYKYLKEHIFTHTGEKPFACKRCGTAYANSGSLFVHEKRCRMQNAD